MDGPSFVDESQHPGSEIHRLLDFPDTPTTLIANHPCTDIDPTDTSEERL